MATPTLVSGLTDWQLFEGIVTFTSIGGGTGAGLSTEIFRQGVQSAGRKAGATGRYGFAVTVTSVDFTVSNRYLWVWWMVLYNPENLVSKSNGGVRILVGTGGVTNYYEYYVGGNDSSPDGEPVTAGRWYRSVLDIGDTVNCAPNNSGGTGANLASIDRVGITVNYTSTPAGNLAHFYIDGIQYGRGYQFTGGSSGDPVTMNDIATYTENSSRAWGIAEQFQGAYYSNGLIIAGNGSTQTYLKDENLSFFYRPQEITSGTTTGTTTSMPSGSNGIIPSGSNTTIVLNGSTFKRILNYDRERYVINGVSGITSYDGNLYAGGNVFVFNSGDTINNCVFDNVREIRLGSASFTNNTIKNPISGSIGTLIIDSGSYTQNWSNVRFIGNNNSHGIYVTSSGTYTFTDFTYSNFATVSGSTGTEVLYNNSGGLVTINVNGGDSPSYRNGTNASTVVNNAVVLTLTNLIANSEIRIYQSGTTTELGGIESGSTEFQYTYNYTPNTYVDIIIHKENYEYVRIEGYLLSNTNASIPIQQRFDRNYLNL